MRNSATTVRALYLAAKVESAQPPYDTIHLKVLYPGLMSGSELERDQGVVPPNPEKAPFPVVIFFGGFNCDPQMYQWLAIKLAERGLVAVTFSWVAETLPGIVNLSPGIDVAMMTSANYGTGPTASALPALLAELEHLQSDGPLTGMLDLQRIVLGGHSVGGTLALENTSPRFFPQVAAAFSYASHNSGSLRSGYKPGTIKPLPSERPLLLMGGTCDGVIANSSDRYGISPEDATNLITRTYHEAISGGRNDTYLVILQGANHFCIADPLDLTTARPFLDLPATQPVDKIRFLQAETTGLFIEAHVRYQPAASQALDYLLNAGNPLIAFCERK